MSSVGEVVSGVDQVEMAREVVLVTCSGDIGHLAVGEVPFSYEPVFDIPSGPAAEGLRDMSEVSI